MIIGIGGLSLTLNHNVISASVGLNPTQIVEGLRKPVILYESKTVKSSLHPHILFP
jgi:hypothetical protein